MTAVKTLAIGALVIGAAVQAASASPYSGTFNWTSWNVESGDVKSSGTSDPFNLSAAVLPPTPTPAAAPVSLPAPVATAQVFAPIPSNSVVVPSPTPPVATRPAPAVSPTAYDAFVNMGNGPYPNAGSLTIGNPQAWFNSNSPQVLGLFGGHPNAQQQADFSNAILQRVEQTFGLAGVPINLTADPNAHAAHTLSVVSNTTSSWGPLLGLTNIGGNGFSFIDDASKGARSVDQLEWIVAHNVSHELMLAFGVGEKYDKSGNYIDAAMATLSMMLSPTSTFSQGAADALLASRSPDHQTMIGSAFAQEIGAQPVPEPSTIAVWTIAALGVVFARRARSRRVLA